MAGAQEQVSEDAWISEIEEMLAEIRSIANAVGDEFWDSQKGVPFDETLLGGLAQHIITACRIMHARHADLEALDRHALGLEIQMLLQHGRERST